MLVVFVVFCLWIFIFSGKALAQEECRSREDVIRQLRLAGRTRPASITFRYVPSLYQYVADVSWMTELMPYADILGGKWRYGRTECTITEIEYAKMERCETREDMKRALKAARRAPLYLHMSPALYDALISNGTAGLNTVHGEVGLTGKYCYYGAPRYVLKYEQMELFENHQQVTDWNQLKSFFWYKTEAMETPFSFHLPKALFEKAMAGNCRLLTALECNCGIYKRVMTYYQTSCMIRYTKIQYYPGKRVVAAARTKKWQLLSQEERQLYDAAMEIVKSCYTRGVDAYTYQLRCHDAIIRRVTYTKNCYMGDTAVGTLLHGRGDCDGYADALYLLCNLGGVSCHYQFGEGLLGNDGNPYHMWNIVKMGGAWYFTDVTWDDGKEVHFYGYMNIGADKAKHGYRWLEDAMIQPLAKATSASFNYYEREGKVFRTIAQAGAYLNDRGKRGDQQIHLMLCHNGASSDQALMNQMMTGVRVSGRYWTKSLGKELFVCFVPR